MEWLIIDNGLDEGLVGGYDTVLLQTKFWHICILMCTYTCAPKHLYIAPIRSTFDHIIAPKDSVETDKFT